MTNLFQASAGRIATESLCVIHLVRRAYGAAPFRNFVESYRAHPAGIAHELILLCKGFQGDALGEEWLMCLDGLDYTALFLPDEGMDISSYYEVMALIDRTYVCFVNTWSQILADDWLATLCRHGSRADVGAVGATGAWWSFYTVKKLRFEQGLENGMTLDQVENLGHDFPAFPNPFLRTNAFLIRRELFMSISGGRGLKKMDALRFENGSWSMTRQIEAAGLAVLVVGRDGHAYAVPEWPSSKTYRSGNQENLLISDNRTRMYSESQGLERAGLRWTIWGDVADIPRAMNPRDALPLTIDRVPPGWLVDDG